MYEVWLVFQICLIHTDLQDSPHFDSLMLSNTVPCNFLLVFWLATLAFMFLAIYLVLLLRRLICFSIFKSSVHRNVLLIFIYYLVNSECRAYLAANHSLVYSYPKMSLLISSIILSLILVLKPSFLIHISVSFYFLFLDLFVEFEFCHILSPVCKSCLFIFNSQLILTRIVRARTTLILRFLMKAWNFQNFVIMSQETIFFNTDTLYSYVGADISSFSTVTMV